MKKLNGKVKFHYFQLLKNYFFQLCQEAFDVCYKRKIFIYQVLTMLCTLTKLKTLTCFAIHLLAFDVFYVPITIILSKQKELRLNTMC